MTLDREAARALFGEAPAPTAVDGAPYAARSQASPIADNNATGRVAGRKDPNGIDWRLVAPVGVAVACIAAIAMFAMPRGDRAVEGNTVAATEVVAPPLAPAPMPMETAAIAPPAVVAREPVVQRAAAPPRPAPVRRTPARTVAVAPSAAESGVDVSAAAPVAPPAPTLSAPASIDLTPATPVAPSPVIQPAPEPQL